MLNNESIIPILKRLTLKELRSLALNIKTEQLSLKQMSKKRILHFLDETDRYELVFAFKKLLQDVNIAG